MKAKIEGGVLTLDPALLEQLGWADDAEVEVTTNGRMLIVTPARSQEDEREFRESMERIDDKYAGLFQRLADS
jgi:antitoxin component of MazEF toxin-antitoxin module